MFPGRLQIDPPADGAWNMAVDEALLQRAAENGEASLRFYQWRQPTLSLGYFQAYAEREEHAASHSAAAVRRLSGGGALVHDRELTYSLCLPGGHPLLRQSAALYEGVHRTLIDALASLGVAARLQGDCPGEAYDPPEPFLCFARRTCFDVVVQSPQNASSAGGSAKVAGSAQRRSRGAILQHGGVLLGQSHDAPELPGVQELTGIRLTPEKLIAAWSDRLAERLKLDLTAAETAAERRLESVVRLAEKYADPNWTKRR